MCLVPEEAEEDVRSSGITVTDSFNVSHGQREANMEGPLRVASACHVWAMSPALSEFLVNFYQSSYYPRYPLSHCSLLIQQTDFLTLLSLNNLIDFPCFLYPKRPLNITHSRDYHPHSQVFILHFNSWETEQSFCTIQVKHEPSLISVARLSFVLLITRPVVVPLPMCLLCFFPLKYCERWELYYLL